MLGGNVGKGKVATRLRNLDSTPKREKKRSNGIMMYKKNIQTIQNIDKER